MLFKRCWVSFALTIFLVAGVLALLTAENNLRAQTVVTSHHPDKDILQLPSAAQPVKVFGKKSSVEDPLTSGFSFALVETSRENVSRVLQSSEKGVVFARLARGPPSLDARS